MNKKWFSRGTRFVVTGCAAGMVWFAGTTLQAPAPAASNVMVTRPAAVAFEPTVTPSPTPPINDGDCQDSHCDRP